MYSFNMDLATPPYRCRLCDAASYRRLTHRGLDGAMQYSGLYRCSGCSVTFSDPVTWREGADASEPVFNAVQRLESTDAEVPPLGASADRRTAQPKVT